MVTLVHSSNPKPLNNGTRTMPAPVRATKQYLDLRLKLNDALQSTLELEELLTIFYGELQNHAEFSGLHYSLEAKSIDVRLGQQCLHQCFYNMEKDGESLGTISFSHSKQFSEGELEIIELVLSSLVYPLRNALKYREAMHLALRDQLTGAGNRTAMQSALGREIEIAKRHKQPFSMLVLDIDKFKEINDQHGHATGDIVLKDIAERIAYGSRRTDMLFRYGGEEFVLLLNRTDEEGAEIISERIRKLIDESPILHQQASINTSVSVGVTAWQEQDDAEKIFLRADKALYHSKENGRNKVTLASDIVN